MQVKHVLLQLMNIKSFSKKEKNFAEFLLNEIKKMGHEAEIDEVCNVMVHGNEKIVVATHSDTIDREVEMKEENGKVYGIGASDAKASIASLLLFLKKARKLNFSIAILSDEEEDATGSEIYLRNHHPEMAIIMEPTSLKICHYHAGNIEASFEIHGEESHGSFCNENVIERTIKMFSEVKKMNYWKRGRYFDSCVAIQEINCQNPYYLNPAICTGRLEARLLAEQDADETAGEIKKIVKEYGKINFREIWNGFVLEKDEEIIKICRKSMKKCGGNFVLDGMPSWTDALKFNEKGIKCVVFGPGELKYSHTKNEYIRLEEIEKATKFLISFNEVLNDFHHSF